MIPKKKTKICITAGLLTVVLLFSLLGQTAHAATPPPEKQNELTLSAVRDKRTATYPAVTVSYRGTSLGAIGRRINGTVYLPLRTLMTRLSGARVVYDAKNRTLRATGEGHDISVTDGAYVLYAGGRPLFSMTPSVILNDGRMYVPADLLAKALSLRVESISASRLSLTGTVSPLSAGTLPYREDEVYWLSRIISAESRGEPLLGQIAVGTVIMNRVHSSAFPSTIYGVIFDRRYGIQFSPVANGTVYESPTYTAILAARICLEGFTLSEEILYFVAPTAATSSWIHNTRTYLFTVKNHEFYI